MSHPHPRGYASSAEPIEQLPRVQPGPGPGAIDAPFVRVDLIHSRCGKRAAEHPYPASPMIACPFPALPTGAIPIEFVQDTEPRVRVVGLPDTVHLPGDVLEALDHLARVCRTAYGMGVEVEADRSEEVAEAMDTLRRALGL